jgi:HAMP domain-containing protein
MKNLRVWQRLALIGLTFTLPLVALVWLYVNEQAKSIEFAEAERRGVTYLRPARQLFAELQQHRVLAAALLNGDPAAEAKLGAKQAEADASLAALEAADRKLGAEFKTADKLRAVASEWQALKASVRGMRADESFARHNHLVYEVLRLIIQMGNASNLILDPDVDSYYAMDATIFKLPALADLVSQSHAIGLGGGKGGDVGSLASQMLLASYASRINEATRDVQDNLRYSVEANPRLRTSITPLLDVGADKAREYAAALERRAAGRAPSAGDAAPPAAAAFDASLKLYDTSLDVLDELLRARVERFQTNRALSLASVGAMLSVACALMVIFSRAMTSRINDLTEAADKISLGEMDVRITVEGGDELGALAERFRRLQVSLKTALEQMDHV